MSQFPSSYRTHVLADSLPHYDKFVFAVFAATWWGMRDSNPRISCAQSRRLKPNLPNSPIYLFPDWWLNGTRDVSVSPALCVTIREPVEE
jgi:hypothetical protein